MQCDRLNSILLVFQNRNLCFEETYHILIFNFKIFLLGIVLCRFSDSTLANILSPKSNACGKKFELKIDEVLFVGHPTLAYERQDREFKVSAYYIININN